MTWEEFKAAVVKLMNERGHEFIKEASFPMPDEAQIVDWYAVPVSDGPIGYLTRHNVFHSFAVGQPAK